MNDKISFFCVCFLSSVRMYVIELLTRDIYFLFEHVP